MTVNTLFDTYKADVANIIPPQRAGLLVDAAGLTAGADFCEVDPKTFESRVVAGIHVLGDSSVSGAMPKSGFAAAAEARACAYAIAALQAGQAPADEPSFINVCYSLLAADYGISIVDVFDIGPEGTIALVEGTGTVSPAEASPDFRFLEADYARAQYASIMGEMFG